MMFYFLITLYVYIQNLNFRESEKDVYLPQEQERAIQYCLSRETTGGQTEVPTKRRLSDPPVVVSKHRYKAV